MNNKLKHAINTRTPRKDLFVNVVTIIWVVTNIMVYLLTHDLYYVIVSNLCFFVFIVLTKKLFFNKGV